MSLAQKSFVTAAVAPFLLAFGLAASDANAGGLISGQCYDANQAKAVLKQEGQLPFIVGNRTAVVPATKQNPSGLERHANVFFVNQRGYGYNIEADTPLGSPAKELCVAMAYKDVHLNNPNNPEIPSWGKNIKSVDGFDIQKAYKNGGRLVFAAQSYHLNTDDSERSGKYVVVSLAERDAAVIAIDATGRGDGLLNMDDAGITKKMEEMLGVNTASPY